MPLPNVTVGSGVMSESTLSVFAFPTTPILRPLDTSLLLRVTSFLSLFWQQNPDMQRNLSSHVLKLPSHQRATVPKAVQQLLEKAGSDKPTKTKKRQSSSETENLVAASD